MGRVERWDLDNDKTCIHEKNACLSIFLFDFSSRETQGTHILDGTSEIGAHVRSNLCYLIGLRHLISSRNVTIPILFGLIFLHACATCSELPFNIGNIGKPKR